MSQNRVTPKYILLSKPSLKYSRSTHEHSFNARSFDIPPPSKQQPLPQIDKEKVKSIKQNGLIKDLGSVKEELNQTMQAMALQQKRNNTLQVLNQLLEASNREAEHKQKREIKPRMEKEKRMMEKEQYQIDQILQKYNEQVARITGLREQVNGARTDRVVFSALFKKIEREIKYYQNLYRETILKTELKALTKSQANQNPRMVINGESLDEVETRDDCRNYLKKGDSFIIESRSKFFMTNPERNMRTAFGKTSDRLPDKAEVLQNKIEIVEGKIDRIVKGAECFTPQEAQELYDSIGQQNIQLSHLIEEAQWKIQETEEQMERIRLNRRNSEVTGEHHMQKLHSLPSTRKLRSCKHLKTAEFHHEEITSAQIFDELVKIVGVSQLSKSMIDAMGQIEQICLQDQVQKGQFQGGNSEHVLDGMLQKMQRFDNCQRIFSKRQFQGEYLRQLSRHRRLVKGKK